MLNKTGLAFAALLFAGSASVASAQTSRAYTTHGRYAPMERSFQSRSVSMPRERAPSAAEEEWMDRASRTWDGGGG